MEKDLPLVTPQMIEEGVKILRREFGGETEGQNRFVDFRDVSERLILLALGSPEPWQLYT